MKSLNIPNFLAFMRVLIAPLVFWLLLNINNPLFSDIHVSWINFFIALLFVLACITDFFDGFIARSWNQKTTLGEILDPLADKMLTLAAFLGLMMIDRANPWAVYLILTREFFITGLRVAAAAKNHNIAASMAGKVKTVFQMIAIGFLLMNWPLATFLLWVAVALTIYSGIEYIVSYLKNQGN